MGLFLVSHLDILIVLCCTAAALDILFTKPLSILRCGLVVVLAVGGLLGADWVQPHLPSSFNQNPTHSASAGGEEGCGAEYDLCITFAEVENKCEDSDDYCFSVYEVEDYHPED
ncbi:MAG: hypothetical protein HOJ25_02965 [Candidatus Magasanikbacteria bacterium]|jgi:hypothetical protein|nr:hypothetical protein [Candidatus Magasanikbacteria bacterium]